MQWLDALCQRLAKAEYIAVDTENTMDEVHVAFVHRPGGSHAKIFDLPIITAEEKDWGILRFGRRASGLVRHTLHYAPNIVRVIVPPLSSSIAWRSQVVLSGAKGMPKMEVGDGALKLPAGSRRFASLIYSRAWSCNLSKSSSPEIGVSN